MTREEAEREWESRHDEIKEYIILLLEQEEDGSEHSNCIFSAGTIIECCIERRLKRLEASVD